jgi:ADP-ribose pyrophosphatase YjhB (NUDIX family)
MTPTQQLALWADQLRAMAALGLHYADDVYNQERYHKIQTIALEMLALVSGDTVANLESLRDTVLVHPTPFAVGDAAIMDEVGRMLLIRRADNGLWAMPGGVLDVGETAAAGVVREALEETGVACEAVALVGVFDSRFWGGTLYHLYQFVFLCRPLSQSPVQASHAHEVREVGWFTEAALPSDLDPNHAGRIRVVFQVWRGERPPYFDQ